MPRTIHFNVLDVPSELGRIVSDFYEGQCYVAQQGCLDRTTEEKSGPYQYDEEFSSALYPAGSHDRLEIPFYRVMGSMHESCTFNMVCSENLA
jgi:hypothetical protein